MINNQKINQKITQTQKFLVLNLHQMQKIIMDLRNKSKAVYLYSQLKRKI